MSVVDRMCRKLKTKEKKGSSLLLTHAELSYVVTRLKNELI